MSITSSTLLRVLAVFLMVRAIENASGVIMALWLNADLPAPPLGVTGYSDLYFAAVVVPRTHSRCYD